MYDCKGGFKLFKFKGTTPICFRPLLVLRLVGWILLLFTFYFSSPLVFSYSVNGGQQPLLPSSPATLHHRSLLRDQRFTGIANWFIRESFANLDSQFVGIWLNLVTMDSALVRLAMNALHGVESALVSVEKLSAVLCYSSTDRTSHRIPDVWARCSSTAALGNLLTSIGQFGCLVFLLHRFVKYFMAPNAFWANVLKENQNAYSSEQGKFLHGNLTLINQAFAISVGKVVDGYASALNTVSASASLRRFSNSNGRGCLTCIGHSEFTLLELYLHTAGLRTQIEALGNICNINHLVAGFPVSSLEDLKARAETEFSTFPRSGALLSFLYAQLKISDPENCALLKFLFIRSYEPYSDLIRTWIFDGSISDPYHEFVVECINKHSMHASGSTGTACGSPLPTVRVRDAAVLPCFLEEWLVPLCRTGQQLQVIIKLLDLANNISPYDTHEEVLPSLIGLSNEHPWFEFPLAFEKETIERMVLVRANCYRQMQEKSESIFTKFDFSEQVASQSVPLRLLNNLKKNSNHQESSASDQSLDSSSTYRQNQYANATTVDDEASGTLDEYSFDEDLLESSECSSSEGLQERDEAEMMNFVSYNVEPSYLSSLDISTSIFTDNSVQNCCRRDVSWSEEESLYKIRWNSVSSVYPSHKESNSWRSEEKRLGNTESLVTEHDLYPSDGCDIDWEKCDTHSNPPYHQLELSRGDCALVETEVGVSEVGNKDQSLHFRNASTTAFSFHVSKLKYDSTFFSMNPSLNSGLLFNLRTILGERARANQLNSYFDFTSVKGPLEACDAKLAGDYAPEFLTDRQVINETLDASIHENNHTGVEILKDVIGENHSKTCNGGSSTLHKEEGDEERLSISNISGGSAWESLLSRSGNMVNRSQRACQMKLASGVDLPLDFVIKKCVMDEIFLQYNYISKLTIKFLKEGFKLQEHLQALRSYHFMEAADWADMFIMSLRHCKWHANEIDQRITEIQGVLEIALQRSSCEGDPYKDRLYVYQKAGGIRDLSASSMGIHYFDFLGLGYRIDWPVNIILTPAALSIYSDIFNFLLQIKLAVFSLSDAWRSLQGGHFGQHEREVHNLSVLIETRHKLNHFVCTLQQYMQSQLSQVSWYRFLQSLEHKVGDMFDLELVHMEYLAESLDICFLSNETQSIAGIIQSILQCAIDFRTCLNGTITRAGSSNEELTNRFSQLNIARAESIRKAFARHVEELYSINLQSQKHGEFGISGFWDYLNYNEYYALAIL